MRDGGVTVVVPTRDRGDSVVRTVRSILADGEHLARVWIVDQSRDRHTRDALLPWLRDARVVHVASETRGLTLGLNEGLAHAETDLVAITGDDCEVRAGWLSAMAAAFASEPDAAVVFGGVLAGAHDRAAGFVQAYPRPRHARARRPGDLRLVGGTSACMAVRRAAWQRLGGFDPLLGVGAPLQAAEEVDFALRALRAGYVVCEEPASAVTHLGFLPWSALAALIDRNWFGTGAAVAKLVRLEPAAGLGVALGMASSWMRGGGVASSLGAPVRLRRLAAFARGFRAGLRQPLDRALGLFLDVSPPR